MQQPRSSDCRLKAPIQPCRVSTYRVLALPLGINPATALAAETPVTDQAPGFTWTIVSVKLGGGRWINRWRATETRSPREELKSEQKWRACFPSREENGERLRENKAFNQTDLWEGEARFRRRHRFLIISHNDGIQLLALQKLWMLRDLHRTFISNINRIYATLNALFTFTCFMLPSTF